MDGKIAQSMLEGLSAEFDAAFAASALVAGLRDLAKAEGRLFSGRALSTLELGRLQDQGNVCADWSRVRIESDAGLDDIRNNRFEGAVVLAGFRGSCTGADGHTRQAGMTDCLVRDSVIGNACLHRIACVERQVIEDGAVLVGLGTLDCPAPTLFGLGSSFHPGTETGARTVWIWDGLTLDLCMAQLALTAEAQALFQRKVAAAFDPLRCRFGFVGKGASLSQARHIRSAYIGAGTSIAGASLIRESTLLSAPGLPCAATDDAAIEYSLLQPGARVESAGRVSRSVLLEHASVGLCGMVSQSVIGPHTEIQKGEATASLLGPFVGFHHQSLLISALWPEGRGNIAYGAKVGSNHTGKKPDQEIRPGEGTFFGLGCVIKFPANFEDAPYSLIAAGLSTLPQRLAFPFSLLNQPASAFPDLGPALNEIAPGWMWSDNAYSLVRRSHKFETSNRARRHDSEPAAGSTWKTGFFSGRIFTATLARKVLQARQSLHAAPPGRGFYLEEHIPGLGKNVLRAPVRERALAAYEDYLAFFLLRTYTDAPETAWHPDLRSLAAAIAAELAAGPDPKAFLAAQRPRLAAFKQSIIASLHREDKRGRQILPDYADFHPAPEADPVLLRLDQDLIELDRRLDAYLGQL